MSSRRVTGRASRDPAMQWAILFYRGRMGPIWQDLAEADEWAIATAVAQGWEVLARDSDILAASSLGLDPAQSNPRRDVEDVED